MTKIKILVSNETPQIVSRIIQYNGRKFKIVAENYNNNCKVRIYIHTNNCDLVKIADREEIPETKYIKYINSDKVRLEGNLDNVKAAENYIKLVYKND